MFIDDVKLTVAAGRGGDGAVAFRREKYVPKGGPAGGNGGRGGNVIFVGEEGLTTLLDFHYRKKIQAKNGENGKSKNKYGKNAEDIYVKVPIGSVVYDLEKEIIIADITRHNQEVIICKGGRGGRGNTAFATPRVPAPEYSEQGLPGEERSVRIELKILADVGLVGFPSVGKSTLISVVSAAKPKIASYPFTTLIPNLGVVKTNDGRNFIIADLPGLIEGAAQGAGLGFQFLRHIERTRVIVHVIDMAATEGRDPFEDYNIINNELKSYNEELLLRPQIVVANKMDIPGAEENLKEFVEKSKIVDIIPISAYTKDNVDTLLYRIADVLDTVKIEDFVDTSTEEVVEYKYTAEPEKFEIKRDDDGVFHVHGRLVQKYMDMTNFNREENVKLFAQRLRKLGVDDELRKLGVKHGDTVRILGYEFEYFE